MKRVCMMLIPMLIAIAVGSLLFTSLPTQAQGGNSLTLNINLGGEPITLDPAKAEDTASVTVIEQLFLGLVDIDDETGEIKPELATGWEISPDGTVYTFTLRSDVTWTDGKPVTAQDVRYGILRTLNSATGSYYAPALYVIKNAEAYNTGQVTDPDEVGVEALDNTHLRITLEYPASHLLSLMAMWVTRPMPQWAIDAYGDAWTEPGNIVTNGPYRLIEWVHGDHIVLEKNPTYYDAANVQIEKVKMWMVDVPTAWQMYLNGQMDTTDVPFNQINAVRSDPILNQEIRFATLPCTYYYGFSITQPPFNNVLVRKAFIAAVNRRGLINDVLSGIPQPALTYVPPGIFGHIDGYAEGVGIPYNPEQARQWLAEAGYPNGEGLPPITLWFNDGHQHIARYIRDNWYETLGISVTLQSLPWGEYLKEVGKGEFQIWRLAWCADYNDAYNFLKDGVARANYGNWYNATYDRLLEQAIQETNPDTRKAYYKQAEKILVETDAVMMPLYYYAHAIATKPYLQRTYPPFGEFDIASWRITSVSNAIEPTGGSLTSYDGNTVITIPAGAITDTAIITYTPAYGMPPSGSLTGIGRTFELTAVYSSTAQPAQLVLGSTYTITIRYTEEEQGAAIEDTLALYWWDGSKWSQEGITSTVDVTNNILAAQAKHFSLFTVLGETHRVYLPLVMKEAPSQTPAPGTLIEPDQYFPLEIGSRWVYSWTNNIYAPSPIVETIVVTEVVDSQCSLHAYHNWADGQFRISTASGYQWLGYSTHGWNVPFPLPMYLLLKYIYVPENLFLDSFQLEDTWDGVGWYGGTVYVGTTTVITNEATVVAGGHTFTNCLQIHTVIEGPHPFGAGSRDAWFAPNVGLVKLIYNHNDGSVTKAELIDMQK